MNEPTVNPGLQSFELSLLNNGLYYIETNDKKLNLLVNLKQIVSHMGYLKVEDSEIEYALSCFKDQSHNYCSFGVFGPLIFSEKRDLSENIVIISK